MAWAVWFLAALHLFLLEGFLGSLSVQWVDGGAVIALFLALHARPHAIPALLLGAALGRGVLVEGGVALHLLAVGIPVAVLLPMRAVFFRRQLLWQLVAALFLVFSVPRVAQLLGTVLRHDVAVVAPSGWQIVWAMLAVPLVAWALACVPLVARFVERTD